MFLRVFAIRHQGLFPQAPTHIIQGKEVMLKMGWGWLLAWVTEERREINSLDWRDAVRLEEEKALPDLGPSPSQSILSQSLS